MKEQNTSQNGGFRNWLSALFDDTKHYNNIDMVRKYNLSFYKLFDSMMIFLLAILYFSTFVSEYAVSLKYVYILFISCTGTELLIIYFNHFKDDEWIMKLCYFGVIKAYVFCMLSSVFFNRNAPAITFYVFLILIPVCFTFKIGVMLAIQLGATAAFCISTILVKAPGLILSDCMNCVIFTIIGVIISAQTNHMRVDNFDMYHNADILRRSNKEIFDTTPCGILQLVFTGTAVEVLFANKAVIEMFGYSPEEFMAKKDWDFRMVVYPEDVPLVVASLQNPMVGIEETYDFRLKNEENGVYNWVSCKFVITKVNGDSITVLTNLLDVDEKKRTESESEAKSRFLSRMSHEIRTPINAIIGMAELERQELVSGNADMAVLENYANETTAASKYLLTLVNDILDTSRIENDKIELQNGIVNAEKYLRDVVSLIKPLADSKGIIFTCTRETHFRDAYIGDGVRVQQILVNILNNAIKFTPSGGTVKLSARGVSETEKTTTLEFTVEDTGIGMTEEFQKRLFQPFAQENSGTTSPFAGTGLGLNIAKALARKMGGDIVCHSVQGKGTTFVITIVVGNAKEDKKEVSEASEENANKDWDFTGVRILLCEDHPLNQKITKALLTRNHCIVEIAGNGAEGVSAVAGHPAGYYSMILMDIRMPIMDGLKAAAEIRSLNHPDAASIPIVAMSANAFPEDVKQSLESGMNAHLAKPVDAALLYNTVARFTGTGDENRDIKKQLILVVDDVEMNAAIIENILKNDYEVITVSNGKDALDKLQRHEDVAAVITDIQMPEMDGIELIHTIRKNYKYDHIAILANTQYDTKGKMEQKLVAIGADDFVYKASSPSVIANRLRNVLARYKDMKA